MRIDGSPVDPKRRAHDPGARSQNVVANLALDFFRPLPFQEIGNAYVIVERPPQMLGVEQRYPPDSGR